MLIVKDIKDRMKNSRGFTMIELLIVMAMLSVVLTAVYSIYIVQSGSAYTQDEVVELQQNLRIGMDQVVHEIKNAGFLLPYNQATTFFEPAVADASTDGSITVNTSSSLGSFVTISVPTMPNFGPTNFEVTPYTFDVIAPFQQGTNVRIIRPSDRLETNAGVYSVVSSTLGLVEIEMNGGSEYDKGEMIMVVSSPQRIQTITFCLGPSATCGTGVATCPDGQQCLIRIDDEGTPGQQSTVVATNMTDLQFRYLMTDGTEGDSVAATDLPRIAAVRVTLTGQTSARGGSRQKELSSVISIRNRGDI